MKRVPAALCLVLASATAASAMATIDTPGRSCAQVQASLNQAGIALLRYRSARNPSLTLYDRYVTDGRYCGVRQTLQRAYVPSRDQARCPVHKCYTFRTD